jgi:hypothetical protein
MTHPGRREMRTVSVNTDSCVALRWGDLELKFHRPTSSGLPLVAPFCVKTLPRVIT